MNAAAGIEHGFTLAQRPPGADGGPLRLCMRVRGGLTLSVSADGSSVCFLDEADRVALSYAGLFVHDADGRALSCGFRAGAQELWLSIDERAARYPITIDPTAQRHYLKASTAGEIRFGYSVAIHERTIVIGAPFEDSDATGVNGDEANTNAANSGAAYVFFRVGDSWEQQAYLKASNTETLNSFGNSVAIEGDTLVVGAQFESSPSQGVNADQIGSGAYASGAVYVFERNGTSWAQTSFVKSSNSEAGDNFAESLVISGERFVVGAWGEDSDATGVGGNRDDNDAPNSGAAYVFRREAGSWVEEAYLKSSNTEAGDFFGRRVDISQDLIVVGAHGEDSSATGVDGSESDNAAFRSGAAYIFRRGVAGWTQEAYLKASNSEAQDHFGSAVAIDGDTVLIGAPDEDSQAAGVDGNQGDNTTSAAGAAYVFQDDGSGWSQTAYLKAINPDAMDRFGEAVALHAGLALVGARFEDGSGRTLDANPFDNLATGAGAAYLFHERQGGWTHEAYLKASNASAEDRFGFSVAVQGGNLLVGAPDESSAATGVDGDQSDNSVEHAGAAFTFVFDANLLVQSYCEGDGQAIACPCGNNNDGSLAAGAAGCANSSSPGGAAFSASGSANIVSDSLLLSAEGLPPATIALLFQGTTGVRLPFGAGLRCVAGSIRRLGLRYASATGMLDSSGLPLASLGGVSPGSTRFYQCWYRDPSTSCGQGFNLSNGLELVWGP